jgi:hypothetical protein
VGSRVALTAILAAGLLAGCGTADDAQQARTVVARFYDAIRHDRGPEACAQLSADTAKQLESQTGQSCRAVVTRLSYEGGAITATAVFITNAKVDLDSGESAFLSREAQGWRLSAVGCKPTEGKPRDRPLDCEVQA